MQKRRRGGSSGRWGGFGNLDAGGGLPFGLQVGRAWQTKPTPCSCPASLANGLFHSSMKRD